MSNILTKILHGKVVTLENFHEAFDPYLYDESFVRRAATLRFADIKGHEAICMSTIIHIAIATENIRRNSMFFNIAPVGYTQRMKKLLDEYGLMIPELDYYGDLRMFDYDVKEARTVIIHERAPEIMPVVMIPDIRKYVNRCMKCGTSREEYADSCPYCGSVYYIFLKESPFLEKAEEFVCYRSSDESIGSE